MSSDWSHVGVMVMSLIPAIALVTLTVAILSFIGHIVYCKTHGCPSS